MSHTESHTSDDKPTAEAEEIAKHVGQYVKIGLISAVFTVVTVVLSFVTHGNILVALLVAACNAVMIAYYTMHLKSEKSTTYRTVFLCLFFCLDLFLVTLLAVTDHIHL